MIGQYETGEEAEASGTGGDLQVVDRAEQAYLAGQYDEVIAFYETTSAEAKDQLADTASWAYVRVSTWRPWRSARTEKKPTSSSTTRFHKYAEAL